jgi:peroxiredoxin Q/BCP
MLDPGTPAPAFEATDHHGRTVRSADLLGRNIVLWFYPMADTPG